MITWRDLYTVLTAVVPLYVAMILAYGSVRWWKIFSPDQCAGINRFVAIIAVSLLVFHFISTHNPYDMNLRFMAADTLQKIVMLVALSIWTNFTKNGSLEWMITIFSLSTLPNTLIMGFPLLVAMYGEYSGSLMVQIVVLQCIIWYTVLLFLFEYRGAKLLIMKQFQETAPAASIASFKVESDVVSLDGRDFLETDTQVGDDGKLHVTVRKSNASRRSFEENCNDAKELHAFMWSSSALPVSEHGGGSDDQSRRSDQGAKEIRVLVADDHHPHHTGELNKGIPDSEYRGEELKLVKGGEAAGEEEEEDKEGSAGLDKLGSSSRAELTPKDRAMEPGVGKQMPPASAMTRLILMTLWRKLIRNPNTYSSLLGVVWSLIAFRWNLEMPKIIEKSISILSDAGLGMAMFSLGLFMALQPKIISCGNSVATFAMAIRFLTGPAVMAAASIAVGLRGDLLRVAIVQAALPQAIVPFVFAKEYNVHPAILSTTVIFGMIISLPITLVYYILLGL